MKKLSKKTALVALLSVFAAGSAGMALSGCAGCGAPAGRIDAPTSLEEDLGTYVIPDYEVVSENGMILAGYNVYLKSVKNADGEELAESYGAAVTVDDAGVYNFVYSVDGANKVSDVTVAIDFADRTAPTINCDDSTIPKFFIRGNSYRVPQYTLSGDFVRNKCWAKVFHIAEDKTETEIPVESNRFKVDKESGTYAIRIHVEDAVGNYNEYEYTRKVDGPEELKDHKVLYLDEEFGERQVSCYQDLYKGGFVSKEESGIAYGDEEGAYKVTFTGAETKDKEALIIMDVPAIIDINEYEDIYFYVYQKTGNVMNIDKKDYNQIVVGSNWWNDTGCKDGEWTKVSWSTRNWGYNMNGDNTKPVGVVDITGMTIRVLYDYGHKVLPYGEIYFSAMYGTPKVKTELELGENVMLSGSKYFIKDKIELSAANIEGKTVDYYKVDGEIIAGDNFVATKEKHKIEVVYVDGDLTKDNMSWAQPDTEKLEISGTDNQWSPIGAGDYWTYTTDLYGVDGNRCYAGVYVGGTGKLLGFEIKTDDKIQKFAAYGPPWDKWGDGVKLSDAQANAIISATKEKPVKAVIVRRGSEYRAYLVYPDGQVDFIAKVTNSDLGISSNEYGYGKRNNTTDISHNVSIVATQKKTELYFETFAATVTPKNDKVTVSADKFYLGDEVTLAGVTPPEGKLLAYFEVNGVRIKGDKFVVTSAETTVEAIYTDASTLTLEEGIETADGQKGTVLVAKDSDVTLVYVGNAPAGKVWAGFKVDGTLYKETTIHVSGIAHNITVEFEDSKNEVLNTITGVTGGNGVNLGIPDGESGKKWDPVSVEYVTDFSYSGPDGTVDKNGVLKVKTQKGENSFGITNGVSKAELDGYQEIYYYVYTTESGAKGGGWWCNETPLEAGKWTKISFKRDVNPTDLVDGDGHTSVWEGGLNNFAIRIQNAPADGIFYITAIYGVPFDDVEVTKKAETSQYLTLSAPKFGTKYRENETVTLSHEGAPANTAFVCYTANGVDIDGNTYKLGGTAVEFGIKFAEVTTLTLGDGITANGETGTVEVGRGAKVTLEYTGTPESGKYFNYFTVNGTRNVGSSFTATGEAYTVAAVFADSIEELTWVTHTEAQTTEVKFNYGGKNEDAYKFSGVAVDEATDWIISTSVTSFPDLNDQTDKFYGFDFLVGSNVSIHIRLHSKPDIVSITAMGKGHGDGIAIGTVLNADKVMAACKAVSAANPVDFTVMRKGDTYYVLCNGMLVVKSNYDFKASDNKFGVGNVDCGWLPLHKIDNYEYRTGSDITNYATNVQVTPTDVTLDKTDGAYKLGDTVTLTAAPAPEGKKFVYFEVNGKKVETNTFVADASGITVNAVYKETSTLTLGEGVATADGETEYALGVAVTLKGNVPAGKVVDYYLVDGVKIEGNTFTTTKATHNVTAVVIDNVADMTWTDKQVTVSGSNEYLTYKFGEDTNWVLSYEAYGFSLGDDFTATVNQYIAAYVGNIASGTNLLTGFEFSTQWGNKFDAYGGNWVSITTQLSEEVLTLFKNATTEETAITIVYVRNGDTLTVYVEKDSARHKVATVNLAAQSVVDNSFGVGGRGGNTAPTLKNVKYVTGEGKTQLYIDSLVTE